METILLILVITFLVLVVIPVIIAAICLGILIAKEAILYIKNQKL